MTIKYIVYMAATAALLSASAAEKIDGLFGVRLGEKPTNAVKVAEIPSLGAELQMVSPDNDEILQCFAMVGTNGSTVAVMCQTPWNEAEAREKIVDGWQAKYGKPSITGSDADGDRPPVEFDTFASNGRSLSFIRQADMVMLQCADVAAVTNMLSGVVERITGLERYGFGLLGKTVGYDIGKKSAEDKGPLPKESKNQRKDRDPEGASIKGSASVAGG